MNASELSLSCTFVCPVCRGALEEAPEGFGCAPCARVFAITAGLADLRLESDRYLDLDAERGKAERLHALEPETDLHGLARAYYEMTDDVLDERRGRFLRHIAQAEARGEALVERLPPEGHILEVGCGTGGLLVAALRRARPIEGVDIAARWLVVARRRLADQGFPAPLVAASVERLPWPDNRFDVVVADSLVEHLDDPLRAMRECARVLRPGGRLVLWSPNRYTLTTDPHLELWGVGWLPRAWVPGYLRRRGKHAWAPRTLSAPEARRLALAAGLASVQLETPELSPRWQAEFSPREQRAIRVYQIARGLRPVRPILRAIGPLWELQATKGVAA